MTSSRMTRLLGLTVVLLAAGGSAMAAAEAARKPGPLASAKVALRSKHFDDAVELLTEAIAAGGEKADEATYLKALALHYAGKHDEAIRTADAVLRKYKGSPWLRKATFLKALSLVEKRQFKAAEAIYEAEANRLLSEKRKLRIAGVIIRFADALAAKPDPDDVGAPPPNYPKACNLYRKALEMEIGRTLRDEVMFKLARTFQLAGNHAQAVKDFRAYLAEFDPDWTGIVGSATRLAGLKREKPKPAGKHPLAARYGLALSQLKANDHRSARVNLEDLLALLAKQRKPAPQLLADARWQLIATYRMPNPARNELERAVKVVERFCQAHTDDPRAVAAAWYVPQAYQAHGRADQAIAAYEAFLQGDHYKLPAGEAATRKVEGLGKAPAEMQDEWRKLALYQVGQIRFGQKKYAEATVAWQQYINKYPNGPQWAACQRGIINAEFQVAVDAVADKRYAEARQLFEAFLARHPLDNRARQILFTMGQIDYARAQKLETDKAAAKDVQAAYQQAVDRWTRLVSKYPNTEESSLALYRIGTIHEEKLGDLTQALDAYRRLTWGSYASRARARVAVMTQKHLAVETERKFRTNEPVKVKLRVRNIEKLTFKQYFLDLEAYFRKTHAIGRVDQLDIDLIQPDKTWEVKVDNYAKYKPLDQEVEVPFAKGKPGVCIVNVGEDDLEATTLIIRSDLDLIVKSSRREALVFVQNMLADKPAAEVELLLSDGKKVFGTGKTGADGVFRGAFESLQKIGTTRVFALRDGHVASNLVDLSGLRFSKGLAAKGYLYTDRPAYQPGQTVKFRGIIREVVDGAYAVPSKRDYLVSITDPKGRLLWQRPQTLSEFGTFHTEFGLGGRTPLGRYTITARQKGKETTAVYTGSFVVQRFKLEKMRLKIETDRTVYFRGETAEVTLLAEYYWGQPVADKPVRYYLPDGRQFVQKTDKAGKVTVKFDTSGMRPPTAMTFQASIEGENVRGAHVAFLAKEEFGIAVKPSRPLVLSGEPFDVEVKTTGADGKPVGRKVTLFVLRREAPKAEPVLAGVPWISAPRRPSAEVTVEEKQVTTDAKTGTTTVNIKLAKGGQYILRATGEDRFQQVVTGQGAVRISDDEDATKLRFFAETDTLKVGGKAAIRLHSRVEAKLALLTYEGETILAHKVVPIAKGYNDIPLTVGHEHFPNFRVAVSVMDGRDLRSAAKPFTVERQLRVTVKPLKDAYAPGAKGKVELTVTDQLGRPVRGELSLALIDEALFAIHPDATPAILDFFQADARRHAEFRLASTCAFRYAAATRKVVKAYQDEKDRLARQVEQTKSLGEMERKLGEAAQSGIVVSRLERARRDHRGATAAPEPVVTAADGRLQTTNGAILVDELKTAADRPVNLGLAVAGKESGAFRYAFGGGKAGRAAPARPRREMPEAGRWIGSIVTDKAGKAVVELPMPENTTRWRLTARGCTVETLVGQATGNVLTRKDFFVAVKAPASVQEGDKVCVLSRVHNLTDYAGPVDLTLTVSGGEDVNKKLVEHKQKAKIGKKGTVEVLFDGVDIPTAAAVTIRVDARAGKLADALSTTVPVRPWGLEFADQGGGVARNDAAVTVELPQREYRSKWMTLSVGPDVQRAVIRMALGRPVRPLSRRGGIDCIIPRPPRWGGFAGSDLLASVAALKYARAVQAPDLDIQRLSDRVRSLSSALVVSQQADGGWAWTGAVKNTDWGISAMSFWALCEARDLGVAVHADTVKKAQTYLQNTFTKVSANDNDAKAVLLHALSANGAAQFAHANRLHRERNALSAPALAYTALALANLKREEFAAELIDVLEKKAVAGKGDDAAKLHWAGSGKHVWLADELEATALTALALLRVRPKSPKLKPAVDYLLDRHGAYGFRPAKAHGPAVRALADYFAAGQFADADYTLTVLVNGKKLRTIARKGAAEAVEIAVPRAMIAEGRNLVEFRMAGRGEYAYAATLRGFSSELKDPGSWRYPYVKARHYRHAPLEYRGKPIGPGSTSPVKNVEIGQRVRVYVDIYQASSSSGTFRGYTLVEEHLPAGMMLVAGSLSAGGSIHHEVDGGKITIYYPAGKMPSDISYEVIGYSTGTYRALPTILRDALNPGRMRVGPKVELVVLAPDEKSDDPYKMNDSERFALGQLYFKDGLYKEALEHLSHLFTHNRKYNERDVARMLLWIYTAKGQYNAKQIVSVFEVLRERYPQLEIPFDKILVVGRAYRDMGEFERAYLVFRATVDVSFINYSNVSAVLEDEGQFLGSIDYQEDLWREYPDTAEVAGAYFALSQALYQKAPKAHELAKEARRLAMARGEKPAKPKRTPNKVEMLRETIRLLSEFLTLYPNSPLADDAAFSMANAFLDLKQFPTVVELCDGYRRHFAKSDFVSGFQYMIALGHFWQRNHDSALTAAKVVADGASKDRDFSRYIMGQIYHAQGKPADAIVWYRKVAGKYADAKQAISYFEAKRISMEEVNIFRPGDAVELTLEYRNVAEAFCQVYRVDLMKLYLRERNLANITKVNLAGIEPLVERTIALGDGKDYVDKKRTVKLALKDEGAYLVICRGDDLFTSALALVTPLKIEVQEDAVSGRVRANVINAVADRYVPEVHVKAIGSADPATAAFRSGETDLRGIFVADNLRGKATVIARQGDARYAFYRGTKWLGAPKERKPQAQQAAPAAAQPDYQMFLRNKNVEMQRLNTNVFDKLRRAKQGGVQIQQAK